MNFEAAIFDLDGTLIDSMYVWQKIDFEFFKKRNMELPKGYVEVIKTMSYYDSALYTKQKYNLKESVKDIMNEWSEMAIVEYTNNIKAKPNAEKYLNYLKDRNIKIGLATASPKEFYIPVLKNNNLIDYFNCFTDASEVENGKDSPDIYILTAKRLGINESKCIVFEDVLKAVKSAKKAGMTVYGVYDEDSLNEKDEIIKCADGYIYNFEEMII